MLNNAGMGDAIHAPAAGHGVAGFAQTLVRWRLLPLAPSQPLRAVREIACLETLKRG